MARPWDREAVHRLFDELEFRVLRERLFATLTSAEPEADEGFEVEGGALAPGTVRAWLDAHARDGRRVGLAVHGRLGTWAGRDVEGIALAAGEPSLEARAAGASAGAAQAAYLDVRTLLPDDEAALGEWLADPAVPKAAHDVKAALHGLRARGWNLDGLTSDTALAAYLARPGQRSFDLADLALRYLRRELRAESEPENGPAVAAAAARRRPTPRARRRRSCRRRPSPSWRTRWTPSWPASAAPACSPSWSCRCRACWPTWRPPASPSTTRPSPRWRPSSPRRSSRPRRTRTA